MEPTHTAYGTWSGGRFMHFGETLSESRYIDCIQSAYNAGIRTFVTSDVYGSGKASELLGLALQDFNRDSYSLVGMIGHDFYEGQRLGSRGFPRFTDPILRSPDHFGSFADMAASKELERLKSDHFDLLLLHNPDEIGYSSDTLWDALRALKDTGVTQQLGIAPGPANGFTLDIASCLERFGSIIDWSMLILSPLEPWPTSLLLPAHQKHNVKIMTRVVDHGGLFHGDVASPDHLFKLGDHRSYRPDGWIQQGLNKIQQMLPIAERHHLSLLQLASIWNLSLPMVESVVPTLIQEAGDFAKPIEEKIEDLATLPDIRLSPEEIETIRQIGDNTGCMLLKGASHRHTTSDRPDEWPMRPDLLEIADLYDLGHQW